MTSVIITASQVATFIVASVSAILSLYSATNAFAVSTDVSVFWSGIIVLCIGVAVGPLFCFIAAYGLVEYLDRPVWLAVLIAGPFFLVWCVSFFRVLRDFAR